MHWKKWGTHRKFVPNLDKFGFVYIITHKKSGKAYIGCKQYFLGKSKANSKWEIYMGSSKSLLEDINKMGKKHDIFIDPIVQYDRRYPERRLYLAVILQALLDATKIKGDRNKKRATSWFQCSVGVTCNNFEFICDHAGVEPGYVRSFAYEVINSEDPRSFRYKITKYKRMIAKEKEENEKG